MGRPFFRQIVHHILLRNAALGAGAFDGEKRPTLRTCGAQQVEHPPAGVCFADDGEKRHGVRGHGSSGVEPAGKGEEEGNPQREIGGKGDAQRGRERQRRIGLRQGNTNRGGGGDVRRAGGEHPQQGGTPETEPGRVSQQHAEDAVHQRDEDTEGEQEGPDLAQVSEAAAGDGSHLQQEKGEHTLKGFDGRAFDEKFYQTIHRIPQEAANVSKPKR